MLTLLPQRLTRALSGTLTCRLAAFGLAAGRKSSPAPRPCVYDEDGQLLAGSLMDYAMPRADNMPPIEVGHVETPQPGTVLGVKGAGEAGTVGALPAVMNAINDALMEAGAPYVQMPCTPQKVWAALEAARHGRA